jgi:septation ring formation regulator EzrA
MTTETPSRVRTTAGCLLRLLFLILLGVGLGVAIYYGVVYGAPALYYQYVHPVQQNTLRLEDLEARQAQSNQLISDRLEGLQARLEALEIQGDADRETFSSLQSGLDAVETSLADIQAAQAEAQAAIDDLLAAQAATGASLEGIQATQAEAEARMAEAFAALGEAQVALDDLAQQLDDIDQAVEGLAQAASQSDERVEALEGELQVVTAHGADLLYDQHLLRALDLLTRAELHLAQGNAGLARLDVATARALLSDLQTQLPARYQDAMAAILTRLDLVLGNLPGAPDLARGDLDATWQLLLRGLAGAGAEAGLTLTPTSTLTTSPTLTTTVTVTPTETITP